LKVIYFSNAYYPIVSIAGAVHAGLLPAKEKLPADKIKEIFKLWDRLKEINLFCLGQDENGNHIYLMYYSCEVGLVKRLVESFLAMHGITRQDYKIVTFEKDNIFLLKLSEIFEKIGFKVAGRWLVQSFVNRIYPHMVLLAKRYGRIKDRRQAVLDYSC